MSSFTIHYNRHRLHSYLIMEMRRFLLGLLLIFSLSVSAQNLSKTGFNQLKKMEDSMKVYGRKMILERTASQRFIADSVFIRMLVRSLKTPNSFNYPFDSLQTVSHIYAPDSTFRIFSWQFTRDDDITVNVEQSR